MSLSFKNKYTCLAAGTLPGFMNQENQHCVQSPASKSKGPVKSCWRRGSLWNDPNFHRLKDFHWKTRLGSHLSAQILFTCLIFLNVEYKNWRGELSEKLVGRNLRNKGKPICSDCYRVGFFLLDVPTLHWLFFFAEKGATLVLKVSHDIVLISFLLELKIKFKSNFIFQKERDILIGTFPRL